MLRNYEVNSIFSKTITLESLQEKIDSYNPYSDRELIKKAYDFSVDAHSGQSRLSGEPYIIHPLSVAHIVADLRMDDSTIAAALLHDVLEDTKNTEAQLKETFGKEITLLVKGVSKLNVGFHFSSKEEEQIENYRRLFVAMAEDIRVIIIKLADRLHNMRTLKYQYRDKKELIARETLEIFAPIAHRLGIGMIQTELENLSLYFLDPESYCSIQQGIEKIRDHREKQIQEATEKLSQRIQQANLVVEIQSRLKNIYSIYLKINRQNVSLEDLHDLIALRAITNTVEECYAVLGLVHSLWVPVAGRFKDYIALPKSNMYQSLHTTVIGPGGVPMEIQIRTREMHHVAEYGIAAHWRYKEGKSADSADAFNERMAWLRQILEWQQDLRTTHEFVESLKIDLFDDEVYVFTPKGDLKKLPKGSSPIDFAYLIHTEVGNNCIGARVNKQIVPLDYELKSGDIVEIISSRSSSGPSLDWLRIAKTPAARNKIRAFLRKKNRDANRERGKLFMERELEKFALTSEEQNLVNDKITEFMEANTYKTIDDLHVIIGEGRLTIRQFIGKVVPFEIRKRFQTQRKAETKKTAQTSGDGVIIQGATGLAVKLARCCTPIPGDKIIGYVTLGKGITVHRLDCHNLTRLTQDEERLVEAEWDERYGRFYDAGLVIDALDRPKLLVDITNTVANYGVSIRSVHAHSMMNDARIYLVISVKNKVELDNLFREIKRVSNVRTVRRGGIFGLR
ncbi:MAG TPA: bifunctional (p)ppGpp synthetase/guanosine-3',5'-bis(diphosphate) 3'-pyrophosphohydrolase [Atribacter sp.]|jgi:guanosine-3',5'-bis(diphosphate) 3'-pyrophosphohydrolase|uniref:RelA/SpoT family protein n=1 Tax=Atribacter sp. TaxID=2847780 RepID=UPI002C121357|nr:bifunctional (p)ppGpp synthetase/guanosine-3',5'-bis(diphosphate) 3'-pyrophosphohydrolase [Atribacter sp.]HQK82600.1 bifunctional (p)ppGpp synthetase/guanosine-3',5'-bis(diphosphate) 3'-pyrophosphohydrolase [Atribacter sp.]